MLANNVRAQGIAWAAPLPSMRLDDLALDRLDGLKIADAASAVAVLDGARAALARLKPLVVIACDAADVDALDERLVAAGYRTRRVEIPWFSRANYHRRTDDVLGGRSMLALLAGEHPGWP